jgi:hypothetical protein
VLDIFFLEELRTDGDLCHQGQDTGIAKKVKIVESDMTILWKLSDGNIIDSTIFGGKCFF